MRYIDVKGLTFYYDDEPVLEDISYFVEDGEFVILTGENGAAKSTLIKATLGLLKPSMGEVILATKNREGQKLSVGYIPQQIASFNVGFPSTVLELVQSGRYPKDRWFNVSLRLIQIYLFWMNQRQGWMSNHEIYFMNYCVTMHTIMGNRF